MKTNTNPIESGTQPARRPSPRGHERHLRRRARDGVPMLRGVTISDLFFAKAGVDGDLRRGTNASTEERNGEAVMKTNHIKNHTQPSRRATPRSVERYLRSRAREGVSARDALEFEEDGAPISVTSYIELALGRYQ